MNLSGMRGSDMTRFSSPGAMKKPLQAWGDAPSRESPIDRLPQFRYDECYKTASVIECVLAPDKERMGRCEAWKLS